MNAVQTQHVVRGLATFIPGVRGMLAKGSFPTSARYCYSVWLRHLSLVARNDLDTSPAVVAELGPGDSLGMGIAALLTGASRFLAFDVVAYADNVARNLDTFDELIALFRTREPIGDDDEFPKVWPRLDSYAFPHHVLTEERIGVALSDARIARIRRSIIKPDAADSMIRYTVPWNREGVVERDSVDLVCSQGAMQYVPDLVSAYRSFHDWLRPGGVMSHQMDLTSLGTAQKWNGHWTYSDLTWSLVKGNRPYFLNREPLSTHVRLQRQSGFRIASIERRTWSSALSRRDLATRFRNLSEDDLTTSAACIQALKPLKRM